LICINTLAASVHALAATAPASSTALGSLGADLTRRGRPLAAGKLASGCAGAGAKYAAIGRTVWYRSETSSGQRRIACLPGVLAY